jgi:hypothetical protein
MGIDGPPMIDIDTAADAIAVTRDSLNREGERITAHLLRQGRSPDNRLRRIAADLLCTALGHQRGDGPACDHCMLDVKNELKATPQPKEPS